jgi:hypothetical protein
MPPQPGEVEDISAAHGGKKKDKEKESLETPHDASFLIYLMKGINGPSAYPPTQRATRACCSALRRASTVSKTVDECVEGTQIQ